MPIRTLLPLVITLLAWLPWADAHPGHQPEAPHSVADSAPESLSEALVTGSGDFLFRYNAELSTLPPEIASKILPAHGGFAKTPSGELYFGLEKAGIVRVSADLKTKTLLTPTGALTDGGLHNTTYVDRDGDSDGGVLVLPDNVRGEIHVVTLEGAELKTIGRPQPELHPYYADSNNSYAPTDTEVAPNGTLYVTDGYSASKLVLAADLDAGTYEAPLFGGPVGAAPQTPGKFSTNHGITLDPSDGTLAVADRERQWVQKFTPAGRFVSSIDTGGANPCDIDFLTWKGEPIAVVGCLRGPQNTSGVVQIVQDGEVVSTLRPKADLSLDAFEHIHNAVGVVVDEKLFVLCYGWNPGCYAVLEHVAP
ncbi:MAG: hypothetical protein AAFV43_00805 [Planctomycetota bacterium]